MLRWYSMSTLVAKLDGSPELSAMTEWSITSSTGISGLMRAGSPSRAMIASRIAARSTTEGTPVKSCISTRSGVKAISRASSPAASPWRVGVVAHRARASMSARVTCTPSSRRRRFSNRILTPYGSRSTPKSARESARREK